MLTNNNTKHKTSNNNISNIILPTEQETNIINLFLSNYQDEKQTQWKKINEYIKLLLIANNKHNLIGQNTIQNIWKRHIIDSIQLTPYIDTNINILDLGSGAGFPAIILGITTNCQITMVEKSPVKAQFLSNVCKELKLKHQIINENINKNNICSFIKERTIITSRAFKSIFEILDLIQNSKNINKIILLKGQKYQEEINYANNMNINLLRDKNISTTRSKYNDSYIVNISYCFSKK